MHTHHKAQDTAGAQSTTNVVDLTHDDLALLGTNARRILVAKDDEQQADGVPYADEDAVIAPATVSGDELGPHGGWAEGKNGEDDHADVDAALADRHHFGSADEGDEFVQASS